MLVVAEQDLAVLDERKCITQAPSAGALVAPAARRLVVDGAVGVEVAHGDRERAVAVGGEFGGEPLQAGAAGGDEGVAQGEVFDGVAGQGLLAGGEEVRPGRGGGGGGAADELGVGVQVAYGRVVLGECDAECRHGPIVPRGRARRHLTMRMTLRISP